jgi:hypothetical protein
MLAALIITFSNTILQDLRGLHASQDLNIFSVRFYFIYNKLSTLAININAVRVIPPTDEARLQSNPLPLLSPPAGG